MAPHNGPDLRIITPAAETLERSDDLRNVTAPAIELPVTTGLYNPEKWKQVKDDIIAIDESALNRTRFDERTKAYMLSIYQKRFEEPEIAVALLTINDGLKERTIGFTVAGPDPEAEDTMKIRVTALHPDFQGRKLVVPLLSCLEQEMKARGFKYASQDATTENGYADKIVKNKGRAIVDYYDKGESHRYIRYELDPDS